MIDRIIVKSILVTPIKRETVPPMRAVLITLETDKPLPEENYASLTYQPPVWEKFREYKKGTAWIRWQKYKIKAKPTTNHCKDSSGNIRTYYAEIESDVPPPNWFYPHVPPAGEGRNTFVLAPPVEITWPEAGEGENPPAGFCGCEGTLTIKNEDGSPATDTILRGGYNNYKAMGAWGSATWNVSGTGGSITQDGVLHASAAACGSLRVTATDLVCNKSAEIYVRVTNAGAWYLITACNVPYISGCQWHAFPIIISGKYKYAGNIYCCNQNKTAVCDRYCPGGVCPSGGCGGYYWKQINDVYVSEWKC